MELLNLCEKIMHLCHNGYAPNWERVFKYFVKEIKAGNVPEIKREIRKIYAGMGSFNDLILQKDGEILYANGELSVLRDALFEEIIK